MRNPKKALQLIGGDTAGNLIYPLILGVCLLAFDQHLDFAQLVVVQVGAGMVGNVAPVPGGIGVTEAALTAGLTSFGIPPAPALAIGAPVPGHHVPDPAVLRVLHPALAARQGLRVGRAARDARHELGPASRSSSTRSSPPPARSRSAPRSWCSAAAAGGGTRLAFAIGVVLGQAIVLRARVRAGRGHAAGRRRTRTRPRRAVLELALGVVLLVGGGVRVVTAHRTPAAEAELALEGGARRASRT